MTMQRTCAQCGTVFHDAHGRRNYCNQACYAVAKRASHERAQALRYSAPKPLASRGEFVIGQTVRVPFTERRTIGGKLVTVAVTEYGAVRKVNGDVISVTVRGKARRCTREQLAACAPRETVARFGNATPLGGGDAV